MNAEYYHQFYGGDIADYCFHKKQSNIRGVDFDASQDLCDIYNSQIKGKPSIDTTGIYSNSTKMSLGSNIERDPYFDKIDADLSVTLNNIAKQIGLQSNDDSVNKFTPASVQLKNQTSDDISAATCEVAKALAELKSLGVEV